TSRIARSRSSSGYFRGAGTDVVLLRQDRNPGIRDSTNLSTAQFDPRHFRFLDVRATVCERDDSAGPCKWRDNEAMIYVEVPAPA
ncbi:hypothetical protein, partial [Streptomyces sp. SID13726]|uniref:hypothetical protein n=1 Tax=Streptomyces sp. SID13726 TaxID=2706058 RepID=UPI001945940C